MSKQWRERWESGNTKRLKRIEALLLALVQMDDTALREALKKLRAATATLETAVDQAKNP
jgi:hypothetical protein